MTGTGFIPVLLAAEGQAAAASIAENGPRWAGLILLLPLLSTALCGLCAALRIRNKLPAWITVACLGASFFLTLGMYPGQ